MTTASLHARRRRHPATEAGLWLVWITARVTGLARLTRRTGRLVRELADSDASHWLQATWCDVRDAAARTLHRLAIRAELAAADLLTGPAPELFDRAAARLRRRAGWLLLAGAFAVNVLWLALR